MPTNLFNKFMHGARRLAAGLREKPSVTIDEHVLQHMLFYHGLSGSGPEGEKEIKRVRADIKEALAQKSRRELSLALKLTPNVWEERLKIIFAELSKEEQKLAIRLLLPDEQTVDFPSNEIAVYYDDWQVRANAAHILSFLEAQEAVQPLINSLFYSTADSALSAYHISYALGKLQGESAKKALEKQLANSDAWLRVDAAGALSLFDFHQVLEPLSQALLAEKEALDYMSYAIARNYKVMDFLRHQSITAIKAGCLLLTGLVEASKNSFGATVILDSENHLSLPILIELINKEGEQLNNEPLLVQTALLLSEWLAAQIEAGTVSFSEEYKGAFGQHKNELVQILSNSEIAKQILEQLETVKANPALLSTGEFIALLKLAGQLHVKKSETVLLALLTEYESKEEYLLLNHIVDALGQITEDNSNALVDLANRLLNLPERFTKEKSKQPVWEEEPNKAKTYWHVLKALGNMPDEIAVSFLIKTLDDYAPDKRARALESLTAIYKKQPQLGMRTPMEQILRQALKDSSSLVQLSALASVASLNKENLVKDILPLIDAHENTVSRETINCLVQLIEQGNKVQIKSALKEKAKTIKEEHKKRRILDILQN